ncbi:cell division protein FtsL [Anaerovirgula multivorans]|uniref:Cell division protein FtsL n=1 Tax=Anaerovirgula multivorans TaxID=312168 RepID=A0A239CY86_9FIRM|nr:cell division protein FtsL [Anaerovirgula multivorans]SNS24621.1 cell division protein FtsL [Anaerovirgula multivorans]
MVVARKTYDYLQPQEQQQEKVVKKQKPLKNYRFEKIMLGIGIVAVFSLSLMLLIRFATITETRYQVHSLNNQLEQLETQKERLRIEVEQVSKSRWIEREAIERLDMQYPLPDQVLYIHVHPAEVAMVSSQIKKQYDEMLPSEIASDNIIYTMFSKIVGLFRI